ncbi:YjhX family toxin [Lentilitoribacter sp. EG35]|uniref:YjhX family toxin n=1 Tax=Lentilitoribacter sp. EG35 TaxID=3234192 RepID=UPI0034608C88
MNISKYEQRVLHVLAQGGAIEYVRNKSGKITEITCYTREGYVLSDCTLPVFMRLKKRRMIKSVNGRPYRITRLGTTSVHGQLDNQ